MLTILGIGRGDLASLTMEGFSRIEAGGQVVLQTGHIPLAKSSRGEESPLKRWTRAMTRRKILTNCRNSPCSISKGGRMPCFA